jgi:hypothetical protein
MGLREPQLCKVGVSYGGRTAGLSAGGSAVIGLLGTGNRFTSSAPSEERDRE